MATQLITSQWADGLGPKPLYIRAAENKLWECIMNITLGENCRTALRRFLEDAGESMNESAAEEASLKAFFLNGHMKTDQLALEDASDDPSANTNPAATLVDLSPEPVETPAGALNAGTSDDITPLQPQASDDGAVPSVDPKAGNAPTADAPLLSDLEQLTDSGGEEDETSGTVAPLSNEGRRTSGREVKAPPTFTSGASLTRPAPSKKRVRVQDADARQPDLPAKIKQEDQYWVTTEAYWNKAVSIHVFSLKVYVFSNFMCYAQHAEARSFAIPVSGTAVDLPERAPEVAPAETPVSSVPTCCVASSYLLLQRSTAKVELTLFDGDRTSPGMYHTFQPDALSVRETNSSLMKPN